MEIFRGTHEYSRSDMGDFCCSVTLGNFDGCHLGHQNLFEKVVSYKPTFPVKKGVITFDPTPKEFFSPAQAPKRIFSLSDKIEACKLYGFDFLVILEFDQKIADLAPKTFLERLLLKDLNAKNIIVGHDFRFGKNRSGDTEYLQIEAKKRDINVTVVQAARDEQGQIISSTRIRSTIQRGHVQEAMELLGRPYFIFGRVVHGRKLGRSIGFRTANLEPDRDLIPQKGVYACLVSFPKGSSESIRAVVNVGSKPTVEKNADVSVEVHRLGGDREDFYESQVKLEFVKRIREEKKFPSLQELKAQISKDCKTALEILTQM